MKRHLGIGLLLLLAAANAVFAQAPPEVQGVGFSASASIEWDAATGAAAYNIYRGVLDDLAAGIPARCHAFRLDATTFSTPAAPDARETFFYLVTAESAAGVEGPPGTSSSGTPHTLLGRCAPLMRNHVLDRAGYGWNEWTRDRVAALGTLERYIEEQLDPALIDEGTNTELATRLAAIEPPDNASDLVARQVVGGVYARRQLAEQAGSFWTNHFNTDNRKVEDQFERFYPRCTTPGVPPQCDANYPQRARRETALVQKKELDTFMTSSFGGTFRAMLEASAKSPAMIVYLDTITNVVGAPNENYAREILELSSMGVDGGYTQTDVEQLSRVFTGWNLCRKTPANAGDPLAPCITNYWDQAIAGEWVANFLTARHDCGQKTVFAGTPQQIVLASTCGNPAAQVAELDIALDAIATHPSTPRYISKKILERFVTDEPSTAMVDALVDTWNDAGNPAGIGDVREVLRAALLSSEFLDPDRTGSKIKTPLEHFVSAFRAVRGRSDGSAQVFNYLTRSQYIPYLNSVPTGWPESGADWVDTNNTLERQNFGIQLGSSSGTSFGSDPITLLNANGVSTGQGNAPAIVDFLADAMFAGALTPAERQQAIDFLSTDDNGNPSNYNNTRIRDLVGFLLGYPQFQEQ